MSSSKSNQQEARDPKLLARQLGEVLARRRKELGLSASSVARDAGLSRSYLSYVENGHFGEIGIDKLARILSVLGASADVVLEEAEYLPATRDGLPEPKAYLAKVYGLSPEQLDQAIAFLDFLAEREHSPKR